MCLQEALSESSESSTFVSSESRDKRKIPFGWRPSYILDNERISKELRIGTDPMKPTIGDPTRCPLFALEPLAAFEINLLSPVCLLLERIL